MMKKNLFNPRRSTEEGIVQVGGSLQIQILEQAYSCGVFPWPYDEHLLWFSPDPRGVLDFSDFHISQSLKKWARKNTQFVITQNEATNLVIDECACAQRSKNEEDDTESETWITPEIKKAYKRWAKQGGVHSFECWDCSGGVENKILVGGIYGVKTEKYFSGESMFYKQTNASKMCFWSLVLWLQKQGYQWMDIQMVTPVTRAFGGKYIPREEFLARIGL